MSGFVQQSQTESAFVDSSAWVIMSDIEKSIQHKINKNGTPLSEWDISINYGIKTGYNDAFIISSEKRNEILSACSSEREYQKTDELIRPILRGRDIQKYHYEWADLWIIWVPWHFPLHLDSSIQGASKEAEERLIKEYPALYQHLLYYKKDLSARNKAETGIRYEWYALQRWGSNYWEDFSKQKIVYREIGLDMDACMVPANWFINNKLYMITGEGLDNLLIFLNSNIFNKICIKAANVTGGKGVDFMQEIRVPRLHHKIQNEQELYNFYGFTPEEVEYLEKEKE